MFEGEILNSKARQGNESKQRRSYHLWHIVLRRRHLMRQRSSRSSSYSSCCGRHHGGGGRLQSQRVRIELCFDRRDQAATDGGDQFSNQSLS